MNIAMYNILTIKLAIAEVIKLIQLNCICYFIG